MTTARPSKPISFGGMKRVGVKDCRSSLSHVTLDSVPQVLAALMLGKYGVVTAVDGMHIELVVVDGVALQGVASNDGTRHLLVVGLDEYASFHGCLALELSRWAIIQDNGRMSIPLPQCLAPPQN